MRCAADKSILVYANNLILLNLSGKA